MKYTYLGDTDIEVSRICLGTMTFGEQNSEAEGHEQMDYALSQGVNFIDTAEMYSVPGRKETQGSTERIIGTWLQARKNRSKIILASKIAGPSDRFTYMRNPMKFNKEQIHQALNDSLKRLQTDYLDLYQLHWPERSTNYFGKRDYSEDNNEGEWHSFESILEALQKFIKNSL